MTKEQFREKTMYLIDDFYRQCRDKAELTIKNMSEEELATYEDNYFAPKAFHEALTNFFTDKVTERSYTTSFVRKHRKTVRTMSDHIVYNGYQ